MDYIASFSISRTRYEAIMNEFRQQLEVSRNARVQETGDSSYTESEALLPCLVSFLLPDKKCRAVMEYDPAMERIRFFREDDPAGS